MSCLALSCLSGKVQVSHQSLVTLQVPLSLCSRSYGASLLNVWAAGSNSLVAVAAMASQPKVDIRFLTSDEITLSMLLAEG